MDEEKTVVREKTCGERLEILERLENWLETPMLILSFVWLALFIYESVSVSYTHLTLPTNREV